MLVANWNRRYQRDMGLTSFLLVLYMVQGNLAVSEEKRLTDYILAKGRYNRLIRPSDSVEEKVDVHFDLLLSQLIGVNEREQNMVTKVWIPQTWIDTRLRWDALKYGNITKLQLPASKIWLPDIVLYNNADGEYEVSLQANAVILNNGTVSWMPPAIYKSACNIQVASFPFDKQNCTMVFRSWTYTTLDMDLHLLKAQATLDDFTKSGEWDIIETPGTISVHGEGDTYQEITYSLVIQRKPLFYTVNLIIPCILITFLAILVFYTPSDCGEKMTLCISVLLALTVFLLLLSKMVPPTSLDVPLIGKYLMFTMMLVTLSVVMSVCVLNVHHRNASTHEMPRWVRHYFLEVLPPVLMLKRPVRSDGDDTSLGDKSGRVRSWMKFLQNRNEKKISRIVKPRYFVNATSNEKNKESKFGIHLDEVSGSSHVTRRRRPFELNSEFGNAMKCVEFITEHLKSRDAAQKMSEDWKFVAMIFDRLLFFLFIATFFLGTLGIFLQPFV